MAGLDLTVGRTFRLHWPEYLIEASGLGMFMISACLSAVLLEYSASPVHRAISSALMRRLLMGLAMGCTAIGIIYSPLGKQSGAHINPAVTLSFFRLRKIKLWDALFYVIAQFAGAIFGVELAARALGETVSRPPVQYVATIPGTAGNVTAFVVEFFMAFCMMGVVLYAGNHPTLNRYTGIFAGFLLATCITVAAPVSGVSLNPARTVGSAVPSGLWHGLWIYMSAPIIGMLSAAEVFLLWKGSSSVSCCKLQHDGKSRCIFCGANGGFSL